jgi:hypothetical protein
MAAPTIIKGEEQFFNIVYEGNGTGQKVGLFVPFTDSGTIANSCIFNVADSPNLNRTISSGSQRRIFTVSFWVKLGAGGTLGTNIFFECRQPSNSENLYFGLMDNGKMAFQALNSSGNHVLTQHSERAFKDTTKWYHFMAAVDTTQATTTDRLKMYVDGDLITDLSYSNYDGGQNYDLPFGNDNSTMYIGEANASSYYMDGYLAEFNIVDGTALTPATFGLTDTSTGRWVPKALTGITYGSNGARFQFGSSSNLGDDTSGQNNDFSVVNLTASDQTTDSPTQAHANISINTASNSSMTFAEGNLKVEMNNVYPGNVLGTLGASSGKYYWEVTLGGSGSSANGYATGVAVAEWSKVNTDPGSTASPFSSYIDSRGNYFHNASYYSSSTTFTSGDVISIALNLDDNEISYYKNNTIIGSAQPLVEGQTYFPFFKNSSSAADLHYTPNFGQKSWNYTPPTGFVALQQDNLPTTDRGVSGLAWIKDRDGGSANHGLYDSSRGPFFELRSNATSANPEKAQGVSKFLKGGVAVGDKANLNASGNSNVAWNWVANAGTTASNSDGATSSTVQANTTAGFSIVQYTGTGGATSVGHGLSAAPEWMLFKDLGNATNWRVYHTSMGGITKYMLLNSNAAVATASMWGSPTASAFIIGGTGYEVNESGNNYIAYCWHGVEGFSRFGRYGGNGSTNGAFVYTGFQPAWVMFKQTDATADWFIFDAARGKVNGQVYRIKANTTEAEDSSNVMDLLSNGFKLRNAGGDKNGSGNTYIYMAFASRPFVGDGTNPLTAR